MGFTPIKTILGSDFSLQKPQKCQKLPNAISQDWGKSENWFSHMFYLTYRGISWARKSFEKTTGQGIFGPGRKNGWNQGSAILGVKKGEIQKFFFLQFTIDLGPIDI